MFDHIIMDAVKASIFKDSTTWDILLSKVRIQQPDDTRKRMQRLLEEIENILHMFNKVVKESYPGYSSTGVLAMTGEQLQNYNFVNPGINISQFLRITPHTTRIYFVDNWDAMLEPDIADPDFGHLSSNIDPASQKMKPESVSNEDVRVDPSDPSTYVKVKLETENFDPLENTDSFTEDIKIERNMVDETGAEKPKEKKAQLKPRVWNSSFPVDKDTFDKMKAGQINNTTCPNCKQTYTEFRGLVTHFVKVKCKKDQKAVEASPDMVIVMRNGEKVAKMVKGEKHR